MMNDKDADDDNGGSDDDEYILKRMKILMMGTPNKKR